MHHRRNAGLAAGLVLLALAAPAAAAPVTVDLRIEGESRTLFEDAVTVDVRPFRFTGEAVAHRCDGTSANQGPSPTAAPTRGAAIAQASEQAGFAIRGTWSASFGSPTFTEVAGENVEYDNATGKYLVEYKNGVGSSFGACGDPIQAGDDVVFGYAAFGSGVLALGGPATARPDERVTVRVTDAGSGAAVEGATVDDATTRADGTAVVGPLAGRGVHDLKAEKDGQVRSNRLRICVTDGADGACGTTAPAPPVTGGTSAPVARDTTAPVGRIRGIRHGQRFKRRRAPRLLRGTVSADPSGLQAVKLSLRRRRGGRCRLYSPTLERFRPSRCRGRVNFRIGDRRDWSYLLPRRLGRGRYVLDVIAIDKLGNRDALVRGRSRVVFFVR